MWTKTSETKPEDGVRVLTCWNSTDWPVALVRWGAVWMDESGKDQGEPNYWMPLPEPPEGE